MGRLPDVGAPYGAAGTAGPLPSPVTGAALALPGERDLQDELDGWHAAVRHLKSLGGMCAAYADGREDEGAERDARWNWIARQAHAAGPAHADLERRRWTVRGEQRTRETHGQPHPGDYKGRDT
jgi:hypothetical protein